MAWRLLGNDFIICDALFLMVLCGVVPVHLTCGKCPKIILQQTEYVTLIVTGNGLALTGQWFYNLWCTVLDGLEWSGTGAFDLS